MDQEFKSFETCRNVYFPYEVNTFNSLNDSNEDNINNIEHQLSVNENIDNIDSFAFPSNANKLSITLKYKLKYMIMKNCMTEFLSSNSNEVQTFIENISNVENDMDVELELKDNEESNNAKNNFD